MGEYRGSSILDLRSMIIISCIFVPQIFNHFFRKPVKAIVGQKVAAVAGAARVRISYNCKQGDCGTCMIKMNGRKVKAW